MWRCSSRATLEKPSTNPGQGPHPLVVVDDEVLPGERQHPLDHHVVEGDRLDQRVAVLGLLRRRSTRALSSPSKSVPEGRVEVLLERVEPLAEVVGALEDADLAEEAVEEADVASLVGDLRAEEDPLRLGRRGPHDRAELVGDLLLADEEAGEPVHPLEALLLGDPLVPVDPVLGEVEVLGRPLLALPEVIELAVVEELDLPPPFSCSAGSELALKSSRCARDGPLRGASFASAGSTSSPLLGFPGLSPAPGRRSQPSKGTGWLANPIVEPLCPAVDPSSSRRRPRRWHCPESS